jgi:hypothetical protein
LETISLPVKQPLLKSMLMKIEVEIGIEIEGNERWIGEKEIEIEVDES